MKKSEFIRKYIDIEEDFVFSLDLKKKIETLKTYISYLELLEKKSYCKLLYILKNDDFVWIGSLKNIFQKDRIKKYLVKLEDCGFITDDFPTEEECKKLQDYMSEYHSQNVRLFKLSEKGEEFYTIHEDYIKNVIKNEKL